MSDSGLLNGVYNESTVKYMQKAGDGISNADWTSDVCTSSTTGEVGFWRDNRNNSVYNIKKFANGKCYMIQNLEFEPASDFQLTPQNTDVKETITMPGPRNSFVTSYTSSYYVSSTASNKHLTGNLVVPAVTEDYSTYYNWHAAGAIAEGTTVQCSGVTLETAIWRAPKRLCKRE